MGDFEYVLKIPLVFGDNAAEIEQEIKDLACEFFGSADGLRFPSGYTAESLSGTYTHDTKKAYVVKGVTVQRSDSEYRGPLLRTVKIRSVRADNAAGIKAEIDRLVRAFFGTDLKVEVYGPQRDVLEASAPADKSGSTGGKCCVERVTLQQQGRWSTD